MRKTYKDTAYETLGMKNPLKDEWISVKSRDLMEKRAAKNKYIFNNLSPDTSHPLQLEEAMLHKATKKSFHADK